MSTVVTDAVSEGLPSIRFSTLKAVVEAVDQAVSQQIDVLYVTSTYASRIPIVLYYVE